MANIAIMPRTYDIHALHPSKELPSSPASQLKNAFKGVYQQALDAGAVSITRNRKREAILLSATLYDQIIAELAARDPLEVLRKDYDARFAAMQTDNAGKALQDAFDASPEDLGKAAVAQASSQ
ncbi:prevent-host-death family protein [Coraliomargarita sp. W4R72]